MSQVTGERGSRYPNIRFICLNRDYVPAVMEMLSFLPDLYSDARDWLEARLDTTCTGNGSCKLAMINNRPIGAAIVTPKTSKRIKISSLYVVNNYCRMKVGTRLLQDSLVHWKQIGFSSAYITFDVRLSNKFVPMLKPFGFSPVSIEMNRYGLNRHEAVYQADLHSENEILFNPSGTVQNTGDTN